MNPKVEPPKDEIDGLRTCGFCYKWLGAWHRKEDCPRNNKLRLEFK